MSKICRTFAADLKKMRIMKKNYNKPVVELMQMMPGSMVMAGSPGLNVSGDPIPSGGGGD